jgi:hypothetical protein
VVTVIENAKITKTKKQRVQPPKRYVHEERGFKCEHDGKKAKKKKKSVYVLNGPYTHRTESYSYRS